MRTRGNGTERLRSVPHADALLTVDEIAEALHCSRTTVFGLLRDGAFPSTKIGRRRVVRSADLEQYVRDAVR
jgi:excisionase family DNA binding protein